MLQLQSIATDAAALPDGGMTVCACSACDAPAAVLIPYGRSVQFVVSTVSASANAGRLASAVSKDSKPRDAFATPDK
jgi:hypothetical protein